MQAGLDLIVMTYLSVFEFLNALLFTLHALSVHSVRPVADASLRCLLKVRSSHVPHRLVRVGLGLNDLSTDAVELIQGNDSSALLLLGVAGTHGVDTTRVS